MVKDTRWETRLLALVAAVLVVFGLTAVYGDWKNEFEGYQDLLLRV